MEGRASLGKLGPVGVVGDAIIVEAIEAATPSHALVSPHKGLAAGVDLNAGDSVRRLQQVRDGSAVDGVLVERLIEQVPWA